MARDSCKRFENDPRELPWGFFSQDDLPGAGNIGMFRWEKSKSESIDHLQWLVDELAEGENLGSEKKRAARSILRQLRIQELDIKGTVERLNEKLAGLVQVLWWGRFQDLQFGDKPFAVNLRKTIRISSFDLDADEADGSPILPRELEDFIGALQEFGY